MDQIGTRLGLMDRNYSIAPGPHKSRFGSIVESTYITPSSTIYSGFWRHINYADLSPLQVEYHDQLDSRLLCGALVGCYALERRDFTDQGGHQCRPWAVYDWDEYTQVPDTWQDTANALTVNGRVDTELGLRTLVTTEHERPDVIKRYCKRSAKGGIILSVSIYRSTQ